MSNHDLKPIDFSNVVVIQNPNNASVVSIFPLVGTEPEIEMQTENIDISSSPTVPQTTSVGGSSY